MNQNIIPGTSVPPTNNGQGSLSHVQTLIAKSALHCNDHEHEWLSAVLACYFDDECAVGELSDFVSHPAFTEKEAKELVREAFEAAVAHLGLT